MKDETPNEHKMLGITKVAKMFGVSKVSIRRWMREGNFPRPRKLQGCHRWFVSELIEWQNELPVVVS